MAAPLVFVSCGVTTMPLVPLLARRFTLVVPDASKTERFCRTGVRAISWDAFTDPEAMAALPARAARLAAAWRSVLARRGSELFGFAGRTWAAGALAAVEGMLASRLDAQLAAYEYGCAVAATGRLAAVVVHEDVTGPVRAFLAAVRVAGVPSIHVPHGIYADDRIVGGDVHGRAHADLVAVGGAVQRDWFVRRGVAPERIVITGNPAWDELCRLPRSVEPLPGLAPGPVVAVATSWLGHQVANHRAVLAQHDRCTRAAFRAVAMLRATRPALRVVVKLHPSAPAEDEARVRALAAEAGIAPDRVVRERAPEVLAASDVLVTLPSTLAVEALLVGTPVVSPEFCYDGDAVSSPPAEPAALAAALDSVLAGWGRSEDFAARRRAFLARYNGPCDGRAAERVAQLVEEAIVRAVPQPGAERRSMDHLAAARLLIAAGYPASALVVLEDAPAADPAAGETVRGEAFLHLHRAEEAEAAFRQAIRSGGAGRAHAGLGLLLLERGARAEAGTHLRAAVASDPELDWGWSGLGVLAALDGRTSEAAGLLARALAINPANPDARRALDVLQGRGEVGAEHA